MRVRHRGALPAAAVTLLALGLAACGGSGNGSGGHASPGPPGSSPGSRAPAGTPPPAASGPSCPASGSVSVSSASQLKSALADARPGQTILLAPGLYRGDFVASRSGKPSAPVTLCGTRGAVLEGESTKYGYTFYLDHASWWRVEGFTVEGGQKGVMADGASNDLLYGLYVHSTGDEAIHLRSFSSHDTVSHCVVRDTGLLEHSFGEGVYVGSAHHNWCRYSGCQPDASNDTAITGNDIAATTAENIDVKEGTTGGQIIGNHLDGSGMVESAATAWVNVKGNDWTIADNTGQDSVKDGFQVHQVYHGWGIGNIFRGNRAQVNGPGYGIYVQSKRLQAVVACDNEVSTAGRGFSTIACSPG